MNIKAVIFDLDGTLVDSLEDLAISVNYALAQLHLPEHPVEAYKQKVGNGVFKMVNRALPEDRKDLTKKALQLQQEYYREHLCMYTQPYPGIVEMLEQLKGKGLKLAVLSNKPDAFTVGIVERLFENDTFDLVWGHRPSNAHKPDPSSALALVDSLGIGAEQTAFIGDTPIDFETALGAGMFSISVTWGFRSVQELREAGCRHLVDHPDKLEALLR